MKTTNVTSFYPFEREEKCVVKMDKRFTDEQRIELAAKLDKELDEFIDGLEKSRYAEGWPEDRWQEEMEKHPFFMKRLPEAGEEVDPLVEGIQQLKYDPLENTPEELAVSYKEDGNFHMKHRKYRISIISYTEGLSAKCDNREINATLYNNRSAAHFFLQNYRSALADALKAVELKPDYKKALVRAAKCAEALQRFDECINYCDQILTEEPSDKDMLKMRQNCCAKKAEKERKERKLDAEQRRKTREDRKIITEIQKRGIRIEEMEIKAFSELTMEVLKPKYAPIEDFPVCLSPDGQLCWPVVFCFPEYSVSDFQQQLDESFTLADCIQDILFENEERDDEGKYTIDTVSVYYENKLLAKAFRANMELTLKEITQLENFLVNAGCLTFYIVPKDSDEEQKYLSANRSSAK
ncbi:DNA polymerase interacting tetratricopeptide repeat-containing, protein of 47 kDa [Phlebotomus argentipes]|uniref:DNA polymerase interacting tetratricopeptide repeat-containing, protein of 47 kDa n=1 Tax=Phlebotomus argentipes TaxID=94469 RepID=UPI00289324A7|nr:DNA polymerase interacting tetratricopeptide repeat-containing, protein of 47 kDa [Phlebotomus argentipes]